MTIDWSKAPADATHALGHGIFRKKDIDGKWLGWKSHLGGWAPVIRPRPQRYVARESGWNGEGLPPLGVVCEYNWRGEWHRVTVAAIVQGLSDSQEVVVQMDGDWTYDHRPSLFRPTRTAEQIAVEEREKAVCNMALSIPGVAYQYPTLYALYDAGYRKQELQQ